MATQAELNAQNELTKKKLDLNEKQLRDSYILAQQQLGQKEQETKDTASKLAQQAYITKQQTERVNPNILSAMGLAQTGYENVKRQRTQQAYQGQVGEVESNLQSSMAEFNRARQSQELSYQQNLQALALERESASLDYQQALARLKESASSSSSSGNAFYNTNNNGLIYQYGAGAVVERNMSPNDIGSYVQQYVDKGYMSAKDKDKMVTDLTNYAYTYNTGINQFQIPTPNTATQNAAKKAQAPNSQKLQKALLVGQW